MKKFMVLAIAFIFTLFMAVSAMAEDLPVDEDVKEGKVSEEDVGDADTVADEAESSEDENLPVEEVKGVSSPSMPAESAKSVYFGDVRIYVGYTTLSMGDYNDLADVKDVNSTTAQNVTGGILLGVDLGYKISSYFSIGPKIQFINALSDGVTDKHVIELRALPLYGGINGNFFIPDASMRINIGAYAGYVFCFGSLEQYVGNLATEVKKATLSGGGFAADFELGVNIHLNSALSIGIAGGYRLANLSSVKSDGNFNDVINFDGSSFDLSGINILAAVNMNY